MAGIAGEAGECSCNTCTSAIHGGRARSYKTVPNVTLFEWLVSLVPVLADAGIDFEWHGQLRRAAHH